MTTLVETQEETLREQANEAGAYGDLIYFYVAQRDLGTLEEGTARTVQDTLIESMAPMDTAFKRDLRGKVKKMLGSRLITAAPATTLDANVEVALRALEGDLKTLFQAFPQDLYLAIYG